MFPLALFTVIHMSMAGNFGIFKSACEGIHCKAQDRIYSLYLHLYAGMIRGLVFIQQKTNHRPKCLDFLIGFWMSK